MISPRITYTPRPDAMPEGELSTLANVYRFVLDSANKNAAGVTSTNGGDAKERSEDDSSARTIIPDK
jgi:hypothetical protein